MKAKFLVGTDIEFFVSSGGPTAIFPGNIPGTKEAPFKIAKDSVANPYDIGITRDGASVEFTCVPASPMNFVVAITDALHFLDKWLSKQNLLRLKNVSLIRKKIDGAPPILERGCSPDFLAYDEMEFPRHPPNQTKWEHCSGHLHFGTKECLGDKEIPAFIQAKFADAILGLWFRKIYKREDKHRIPSYGLPGLYRPKPYGFEYRLPANSWVWNAYEYRNELTRRLCTFESLFSLKLSDIQHLYNRLPWPLIKWALSPGNSEEADSVEPTVQRLINRVI